MNLARPSTRSQPRVVIVGAGFGGLSLARALRRAPVRVVLLDRNNYHLFTPLLYQVASALLNPSEIAQPIRKLVRRLRNCEFRMTLVTGVDLERRLLATDQGPIPFDYLVLAAGSQNNYFGNPTLERLSLGLKELPDALSLRNWVLRQFEMASWEEDPERRRELLNFTVVGGGPTGVEYAGALTELIHRVLSKDFRGVDISAARVHLLEATGEILAAFAPRLRRSGTASLRRMGVEVLVNSPVKELRAGQLFFVDGRVMQTSSVIWTAGVRGAVIGETLGVELGRLSRVPVGPTLQLEGHPEVMVIGDLADLNQLPMLAQVAIQQARLASSNIQALIAGGSVSPFHYRDRGIMATIGRNSGLAEIGSLQLSGFAGWVMWLFVHLLNIVTFRARLAALINWAWDYVAVDRPIRLLLRAEEPEREDPQEPGPGTD